MPVQPRKAAVLFLACALVSSCDSRNSPTTVPSVAPITSTGPTPGHWHAAWTRTLALAPEAGEIRDLTLVGGVLVTASSQDVEALNARTGATVWRSASIDRSGVAAFAVSEQQVVIATRNGRWFSVHAPTGRVTWRSPSPSGAWIPYSDELQALATSAAIPVVSIDTNTISGVDGLTGRTKWNIGRRQLYGCTPDTSRLTQPSSVETKRYVSKNWLSVPVTCGAQDAVVAVNAATGQPTWHHSALAPDEPSGPSANDRFVGINDDGYGLFEQQVTKGSHNLIIQDPSGRVKTVRNKAESHDIWGPLSPLVTVSTTMIFPFTRQGKHYFTITTTSGDNPSIVNLSEELREAAFDGTRAYEVQENGQIKVATVGQAKTTDIKPLLKGKPFWIAAGNNTLFIATTGHPPAKNQVTITAIGN
ncbi:outer membrane protein assembly factor BamB family protein [Actinomadura montaniterrae]|uniref:PQQ-binding-like beta-propeller repeat protein n=1 Tax=Actinomadura montaniterrae TaxID=1803903 RepID=A0A6L3VQT6_9ACTN|nr:PQQ-binding-like beta-propeller repeat protein [Actinomadura montaniterrae]KAB2374361.1 PQQ-binding-like beta-propeller repeat protein [Actinomadura montaniterrae]